MKRRTWAACWSASRLQRAGGEGGGRAAVRVRSSTVGVKGPCLSPHEPAGLWFLLSSDPRFLFSLCTIWKRAREIT